eukprot:507007_1
MPEEESHFDVEYIKSKLGSHPDFPKKGITFFDVFPIFRDPAATEMLVTRFMSHIHSRFGTTVDAVAALDARGFILGPILAMRLGCSFVPIRKKGKLPGETTSAAYSLEYGEDCVEIQNDALKPGSRVIIVDDLIATGGTMAAACDVVKAIGGDVLGCMAIIELTGLDGRKKIGDTHIYSLLQLDD